MASYLHPGVYIEEIPSGSKPIEGVSTSITAFVGQANKGPVGEPVLIGKLDDYTENFGTITSENDHLGLAVLAFYLNGGKAAYICRLTSDAAQTASVDLAGGVTDPVMTVSAANPGVWANDYFVLISNSDAPTRTFDLAIGTQDSLGAFVSIATETYTNLSMDSTADNYVESVVNVRSDLVQVSVAAVIDPTEVVLDTAAAGVQLNNDVAGVDGGTPEASKYTAFYNSTLRKFRDASIIVLPGQQWEENPPLSGNFSNAAVSATRSFCETYQRSVLIMDLPQTMELTSGAAVSALGLPTSTYMNLYYPWINIANPLYNEDTNPLAPRTVGVPPSAFAAGMYARIDGKRGVWKAPAGVETNLAGVSSLNFKIEDLEQDQLNPLGVNCIRKLPNYGSVIWGSRTLSTRADPEWRYVPVRRTAIFIEQSIYQGIQWAVFEPNDHPLWGSLRANIGSFMNGLFRSGAFQGAKANDAYFVRCGLGDTMTQGDIDRGQVIVIVGFAPLKPAEFVIVRIQQKVGQQ